MPLSKKVFLSFLITLLFSLPFTLVKKNRSSVLPLQTKTETVPNVTARVGEYLIRILSGWASPYAEVYLNGQGTARKTTADANGYFEFLSIPIKKTYGELCLTSQDVNHLPTLPLCLPDIPPKEDVEIIGVLLPPTISLDKANILPGESAKASGMTFPNSEVDVYLFSFGKETPRSTARSLLALTVYAAGLPKYAIKTNENGFYEFSLPSVNPSENRLFTMAKPTLLSLKPPLPSKPLSASPYLPLTGETFYSPKSNTLSFLVFKPNWLWLLLLLAVILIALILEKKRNSSLMIVENDIVLRKPICKTDIYSGPKMLRQ